MKSPMRLAKKQTIFLATDLTLPSERIYIGEVQEIQAKVQQRKAEFILIIEKNQRRRS